MTEIWKPCPGYPGYEVSDLGNVRSPKQILSPAIGSHGYLQVQLRRKNVRTVHSLVLEAHVGPCPVGMESRHSDGDKKNCRLDNLCWGTPKQNGKDKIRHGTAKSGARKSAATRERNLKMSGHFSVEDMCRAGCTTRRGVRFWEEKGLLGPVERTDGDTRRYTADQLDKAKIIAAAQFGGWSLEEIAAMLAEWGPEAHEAILTRLADQAMAAARLGEQLPCPPMMDPVSQEYDL
jgi:DNA-binding transcriptional MerR regulator